MPNLRSIPALAIVAATLAACFGAPSASPAVVSPTATAPTVESPDPTAAPTPTASVSPSVSELPIPAGGCIAIDQADLSELEVVLGSVDANGNGGDGGISVGRVGASLDVTGITERTGQGRTVVPPARVLHNERGLLLGGHEFVAFPSTWFDGHDNPQAMISAKVTLTLQGQSPIDLPTRFIPGNVNFDQVAVTVPEATGPATLSMTFVWADSCFRYEARTAIAVDVVPLAETAGCALGWNTYLDQVGALLDGSLRVGSTTAQAFSPRNEAKFLSWGNPGIDAFIIYAFRPGEPAIVVAPGVALPIRQVGSDLTLGTDMHLWVWRRASVAKAVKDYPPNGTVLVLSGTSSKRADGSFSLDVPRDPGRYVAGVELTYDSQCSSGTLWFVVNIDIVTPAPSATPNPSPQPSSSPVS